jgi:hypothetical protein
MKTACASIALLFLGTRGLCTFSYHPPRYDCEQNHRYQQTSVTWSEPNCAKNQDVTDSYENDRNHDDVNRAVHFVPVLRRFSFWLPGLGCPGHIGIETAICPENYFAGLYVAWLVSVSQIVVSVMRAPGGKSFKPRCISS